LIFDEWQKNQFILQTGIISLRHWMQNLKIAKSIFLLFLLAVSVANLAFFVYWYSASEVTAIMPSNTGYTIEVFAALGLFGYIEIKNAAVNKAVEEARETVSEQFLIWQREQTNQSSEPPEYGGDYKLEDEPVTDAKEAKGE
jgi:hypothetical protein